VGNKVRSGTTKDIEVDTNLLGKGEIRLRQWIDDRNGVRIQENVRISLYSGGALGVRVTRGEQDQEARR
jgi:hypothetical protein